MPETASTEARECRKRHDGYAWIRTNGPRRLAERHALTQPDRQPLQFEVDRVAVQEAVAELGRDVPQGGVAQPCDAAGGELPRLVDQPGLVPCPIALTGHGVGTATPAVAQALESSHAGFDHVFRTHLAAATAVLDAGVQIKGWGRTVRTIPVVTAADARTSPVCRFHIPRRGVTAV